MQNGMRIYYDNVTGIPVFISGECKGEILARKQQEVKYVDLPFGDETLKDVSQFHIENGKIIVDKRREHIETEEEKLRKEKEQVENLLLMKADENLGGIL